MHTLQYSYRCHWGQEWLCGASCDFFGVILRFIQGCKLIIKVIYINVSIYNNMSTTCYKSTKISSENIPNRVAREVLLSQEDHINMASWDKYKQLNARIVVVKGDLMMLNRLQVKEEVKANATAH